MTAKLTPADLASHARLGIDPDLLDTADVRRVTDRQAREDCGLRYRAADLSGIAYPRIDPWTEHIVGYRVRRDNPDQRDGRPHAKYISSPDRAHAYIVAGTTPEQLADVQIPIAIVEAEKSALAITCAARRADRSLIPIALGGCWGWWGRIGRATATDGTRVDERGELPDWDCITWRDRIVYVALDANTATSSSVQAARRRIMETLTARGADARVVEIPTGDGINGPDDLIGVRGDAAWWTLVDGAQRKTTKAKPETPKQGHDVQLDNPEPWPDPVAGADLLDAIAATCAKYLALPTCGSSAISLWVLHAYAFAASFTSPFLAVTSPVKRCGKTLLLIALGALVPRRLYASNVTPAVLFRTIEKYKPTLLIDEADTFVRDNDELRGLLNSGHTRTTATVIRAVGDDHDPRAFSTWCPKAIALIGKLPGTLDDRAIEIRMRRRTPREQVARLRQDRIDSECQILRRQAARWADDHLDALRDADPEVPITLHDRAADCWRPLFAIADIAGGTWPSLAREAAAALSGIDAAGDAGTLLLGDIRAIFADDGDPDVLASTVIVERLVGLDHRPWSEWSNGRALSTAKLARMLGGYDVHPAGNIRIGSKVVKGYRRTAFLDAWSRYLEVADPNLDALEVPKALQGNNANKDGPEPELSNGYTPEECSGLQSVTNPMITGGCYAVALSKAGEAPDRGSDGTDGRSQADQAAPDRGPAVTNPRYRPADTPGWDHARYGVLDGADGRF